MGKHEHVPFRMVIEGNRLVPSNAHDAERLDTYRRGTEVRVTFTEEKDRPLVRKWWAVLGLVVKQCDVPWQNKEQASEAIKLALGIVNLSKTVSGNFMQYPKSLTELTEPEIEEAVEQMMALVQRMTGVDPATLKKEANVEDEQEPSASPSADDGSGDSSSAPEEPAADNSAQQSGPEAGASTEGTLLDSDEAAHGETVAPASASISLMEECRDKLIQLATDENLSREQRWGAIEKAKDAWKKELPQNLPFVKACFEAAGRIVKIGPDLEADERAALDKMIDEVRP